MLADILADIRTPFEISGMSITGCLSFLFLLRLTIFFSGIDEDLESEKFGVC